MIDGRPMIVEQAVIPVALAPGLDHPDGRSRRTRSTGCWPGAYGLEDDYEEQYLEVVAPSSDERRLLELDEGAQVVRLRGVSFAPQDVPFDCFQQVYPASEVVFSISGQTARHVFRGTDLRDWSVTPVAAGPSHSSSANRRSLKGARDNV